MGLKDKCLAMNLKQKMGINTSDVFFVGANWLFLLFYLNRNLDVKNYNSKNYYLLKGIFKNYNAIFNGKKLYGQPINSDIKRYKEIENLTTGQDKIYTTRCLLHNDYFKNHYRIIAVELSRQKELDANSKAIQQIEFVGHLKNLNAAIVAGEVMFFLKIL